MAAALAELLGRPVPIEDAYGERLAGTVDGPVSPMSDAELSSGTVKAITTRRNQQIAEALWDGVPPAAVAAATAPKAVRTIGLSYQDLLPQGARPDTHIITVSSTTRELQDAEDDKTRLKRQRDDLIATAHRLGTYDEYQIGALTGVPAPEIKRMIRGTRTVPSKPVRSE